VLLNALMPFFLQAFSLSSLCPLQASLLLTRFPVKPVFLQAFLLSCPPSSLLPFCPQSSLSSNLSPLKPFTLQDFSPDAFLPSSLSTPPACLSSSLSSHLPFSPPAFLPLHLPPFAAERQLTPMASTSHMATPPYQAGGPQHNTTLHNTTQHNTTQHNTTQHSTAQHNTTQHNTTQHNTTQHNTTQHNTCVSGAGRQAEGVVCGPRAAAQRNAAGGSHPPHAPAPGVCG